MGMRLVERPDYPGAYFLVVALDHGHPQAPAEWNIPLSKDEIPAVQAELKSQALSAGLADALQRALDSTVEDLKKVTAERDDLKRRVTTSEAEVVTLREDNVDLRRFVLQVGDARAALKTIRDLRSGRR